MSLIGCNSYSGEKDPGGDVPPPVIHGSTFKEAKEKDYTNMTVSYALNSASFGEEYGYEYYFGEHDFVAVYDGNTAEMYGNEFAWMFYSYYEGESYAYWKQTNSYVTSGWISTGSKGIKVGIDYAYFYMPYFLNVISEDDVENILGLYVVKENAIDKVLEGLKFTYLTNDIHYIDIQVNDDGYFTKIRGYDDPNDDSIGFQIQLSNFGSTTSPTSPLPPEISESTIKTYEEMIGHEEAPDVYIETLVININEEVDSDENFDIILYPDDTIDLSFTYTPDNANKKEVRWASSNNEVVTFDSFLNWQSGHKYLTALREGEAEIYVTHTNGENQVISSQHLKVKVNAPKEIEVGENDVYSFLFTDSESLGDDAYKINATNNIKTEAPFVITSYLANISSTVNGDIKVDDTNAIMVDWGTSQHMNDSYREREGNEVFFDFEAQQVSSISFLYGLQFSSHITNLSKVGSAFIKTSNDGENWSVIDITEEITTEIAKTTSSGMTPKILTREFEPASMVKLVFTTKHSIGFGFWLDLFNFVFGANESCINYDDTLAVPVTGIEVNGFRNKLKVGSSMKLSATVSPANASNKNVKWASSNPEIVKVDNRGMVTALTVGEAVITATSVTNGVVSNEFVIKTYTQEYIDDPEYNLIGQTFSSSGVNVNGTLFDVSFKINNSTSATLTLLTKVAGIELKTEYKASFDGFDSDTGIYEFLTEENGIIRFTLSSDKESIEFRFIDGDGEYVIGNASNGISLSK